MEFHLIKPRKKSVFSIYRGFGRKQGFFPRYSKNTNQATPYWTEALCTEAHCSEKLKLKVFFFFFISLFFYRPRSILCRLKNSSVIFRPFEDFFFVFFSISFQRCREISKIPNTSGVIVEFVSNTFEIFVENL